LETSQLSEHERALYNHVPKYYKVLRELESLIVSKAWTNDTELPSEKALCEQFQVSRGTVRRALDELERKGLIIRSAGKATRVFVPKIPLFSTGFRGDIQKKGLKATCRVLSISYDVLGEDMMAELNLHDTNPVTVIHRLLLADSVPLIIEKVWVLLPHREPFSEQEIEARSLLDLIPQKCGVILQKAKESYEPIKLKKPEAELLHAKPGDLAIFDQAIAFDIQLRPVFISQAIIHGDKARIVTESTFQV
jgi:GntR family transcriptional regulator